MRSWYTQDRKKKKKTNPIIDIFYCCKQKFVIAQQNYCNLYLYSSNERDLTHAVHHSCCPKCLQRSIHYTCTHPVRGALSTELFHVHIPQQQQDRFWNFSSKVSHISHICSCSLTLFGCISAVRYVWWGFRAFWRSPAISNFYVPFSWETWTCLCGIECT